MSIPRHARARASLSALLSTALALTGLAAAAEPRSPEAEAAIGRVMQQARSAPQNAAALDGLPAAERAARLRERESLLKAGEAALARRDPAAALQSLERAAALLHAADTEMTLVRAFMQQGEYRRAVAFVAHTAGAHREVPAGAALYAWLLALGGHRDHALRLLDEAEQRFAGEPLLAQVRNQLQSRLLSASGPLLAPPARLAPYADAAPARLRMLGSGLLTENGRQAIVPAQAIGTGQRLWLRNGLGQTVRATLARRDGELAVLTLAAALPAPALQRAPREPFPGSVAYTVQYATAAGSTGPVWPVLSGGFAGAPLQRVSAGADASRALGIELPAGPGLGSLGGPVFDQAGRVIGLALRGRDGGADRLLPVSRLPVSTAVAPDPAARLPADEIYERALLASVQLLVER